MAWPNITTEMADISRLETFYKTEYHNPAPTVNDMTNIRWSETVRNLMSKIWARKNGDLTFTGPIADGTYDGHYFLNNTTDSERQTIADDINNNRSSLDSYDASNDYHVKIVDNIVREIKAM